MGEQNAAYLEKINRAAAAIEAACGGAEIAVILGSGLGGYAEALENPTFLAYQDIPGFPVSTAPGHAGRWCAGTLHGKRVCMMQGRFHAYEGYDLREVTLPVRVMKRLGVKTLIVTNASGGVNTSFTPGDLMLMTDFINLSGKNPLTGPNLDEFGPRFPDMSRVFDRDYMELFRSVCADAQENVREGVYFYCMGPNYETPAEIRAMRTLGADAVGMSTVPECIAARHCGMRILGITLITNMAAGILDKPLSGEEVIEAGNAASKRFVSHVAEFLKRMPLD